MLEKNVRLPWLYLKKSNTRKRVLSYFGYLKKPEIQKRALCKHPCYKVLMENYKAARDSRNNDTVQLPWSINAKKLRVLAGNRWSLQQIGLTKEEVEKQIENLAEALDLFQNRSYMEFMDKAAEYYAWYNAKVPAGLQDWLTWFTVTRFLEVSA